MRVPALAIVLGLLLLMPVAHAAEAPVARKWTVAGVEREGLVCVPKGAKSEATPVIFAFHGHGGTARHAARTMDFQTQWPEAIVVYLQGLNTPGRLTDPEGKKPGWQSGPGELADRDLKFFDAVLASLKTDYQVDAKRIYASGHSNGGSFTYLLWATRGDTFAAVAPSGAIPIRGTKLAAKPALHLAGEQDPLVRFAWQQRGMELVRQVNGCEAASKPWDKAGDLVGTEYPSKTGTPFVSLLSPGGHQFPVEAPKLIVKFFKEHPGK